MNTNKTGTDIYMNTLYRKVSLNCVQIMMFRPTRIPVINPANPHRITMMINASKSNSGIPEG